MPTSYPSGLDSFTTKVNGQVIDAAHVNNVQDPIVAIETAIGINPLTISDTTTPGPTPTFLGGYISGPQIGALSMLATQIRLITGGAAWWNNPVTTLASLNARLGLPTSPAIGDMVYYNGSAWVRLAIGTAGQLLDVVGGIPSWQTITAGGVGAIPAPASPVTGDLLYYNGASWVRLAVGTAGQSLVVSGGIPAWTSSVPGSLNDGIWTKWNAGSLKVDVKLRLPAVVASDGTITEYANIQNAINAATSGQWVAIPPGTYTETLTLKSGVVVTELIRGTVTLTATANNIPVTAVAGSFLSVDTVTAVANGGGFNPAIYITGSCTLIVRSLTGTGAGTTYGVQMGAGGATANVFVDTISVISGTDGATGILCAFASTLNVYARSVTASAPGTGYGVDITAGTINLRGGAYSGGTLDLHQTGGTLNIYDCQYDITKTSGTLTFLTGDRMRVCQQRLFAQVFSS